MNTMIEILSSNFHEDIQLALTYTIAEDPLPYAVSPDAVCSIASSIDQHPPDL